MLAVKLLSGEYHGNLANENWVNIGSGKGLVLSGSKPLPETMLTQIYIAIWRHYATIS